MRWWIALGVVLGTWVVPLLAAGTTEKAQAGIQAAYDKAAKGARLKFIYGMLSHRSADFELFGPDGRKIDLTLERDRFRQMLGPAVEVKLTTRIQSLQLRGPSAECRVEQSLRLLCPDKENKKLRTELIQTRLNDLWLNQAGTWRLRASQVLSQERKILPAGTE